jgi:hypothetical protein
MRCRLVPGMIGHGCRSPRVPDSMYSSARIRPIAASCSSLAWGTSKSAMMALAPNKHALVKMIYAI